MIVFEVIHPDRTEEQRVHIYCHILALIAAKCKHVTISELKRSVSYFKWVFHPTKLL